MSIIRAVLGSALLASMMIGGSVARASEEDRSHQVLLTSLRSVGVRVSINDPICQDRDADGMYISMKQLLVVCQDNAKWSGDEVEWTENDYDTLRHEAHHVLQDCVNGELGDGLLADFFNEAEEYNDFINGTIGPERAAVIAEVYGDNGASRTVILNEVEAFAVAHSVSAEVIGEGIVKVCGNK